MLREKVLDLGVRSDFTQEQSSVAPGWVALEAKQGAWLFGCEGAHLSGRDDCLGEFELAGVYTLQIGMAALACRLAAFGRRAERF